MSKKEEVLPILLNKQNEKLLSLNLFVNTDREFTPTEEETYGEMHNALMQVKNGTVKISKKFEDNVPKVDVKKWVDTLA